jgi:hypothetical protein
MAHPHQNTPLADLALALEKIEALASVISLEGTTDPALVADCILDQCRLAATTLDHAEAVYGRRRPLRLANRA